ncbi:MAG: adenosylcobinamide-phosphate synthase CbiB [Rhodobacteraceae bacterium]|nr:adenosylcobinamide-phosphate synthase CbiB [Paracoccaceae bacterium]
MLALDLSPFAILAFALILDALLGEPEWLWRRAPHPAVTMGRAVSLLEAQLNQGPSRRLKGAAALIVLIIGAGAIGLAVTMAPVVGSALSVLFAAILLAQRSLADHVSDVAAALRQSLPEGREAVSLIVGRDPETLDEAGVSRAAIESAAENFSDGVVAPAFWLLVGGLPGILIYKAVNTADSMIGHRSERYHAFGWATARLDDLLNLIPARLSGLLLCAVGSGMRGVRVMWRDARLHKSPNAGWPEAASAAALGVALAGPRVYGGALTDDPWVHPEGRHAATPADIDAAVMLIWQAWALLLAGSIVGAAALTRL